jgi:VanZ family protein
MTFAETVTARPTRGLYRVALALCVLAVAYLAFTPLDAPGIGGWDKLNHALAFFVMAWLAAGGFPGRKAAPVRWGLLLGYGLLIELVQSQLPFRDFSLLDLLADAVGILLYTLTASLVARRFPKPSPAGG